MRRRTTAVLAGTILGLASVAGLGLRADAEPAADPVPVRSVAEDLDVQRAGEYWACLVLDYVEAGTCLEDPLPDPSQLPSVRQLVYDLTGIEL